MIIAICAVWLAAAERSVPSPPARWITHGPQAPDVQAFVLSPVDDDVAYAVSRDPVGGEAALFRTADGGEHWTIAVLVPEGESVERLAISPTDPRRLTAQTYDGLSIRLYETRDAGASWMLVDTRPSLRATALFYDFNGFAYLVTRGVAFTNQAGLWTKLSSLDLSSGWPDRTGHSYFTNKVHDCRNGGFFCYDEILIVERSTGDLTSSGEAPCEAMVAAYAPSDASIGYGWNCGGLRTTDGGTTWERLPIPAGEIAIDPVDAQTAYSLLADSILATRNAFASWRPIPLPDPVTRSIAMSATGRYLYAATANGVFRKDQAARETIRVDRASIP